MNPEKRQLLDDVLGSESRRQAILLAGGSVLRRRQMIRRVGQSLIAVAIVACLVSLFVRTPTPSVVPVTNVPPSQRAITDDELLALFPDTPVALATLPDGRKQLIFPRTGDDQRFVTRL